MKNRCARVARPTSTSSRPVANGSSVPACPTFVPRGSERRTSATTSCEVTPAGFARRSTPSMGVAQAAGSCSRTWPRSWSTSSGYGTAVEKPAACGWPPPPNSRAMPRHVHRAVGGAQAHLAHPLAVVGEQLAHQHRHARALDGAHVVHHALGVGLERAGLLVVALRQVGDRERAVVVALHARQRALKQLQPPERQVLVQLAVDLVRLDARRRSAPPPSGAPRPSCSRT